jgi:hypothetical protein
MRLQISVLWQSTVLLPFRLLFFASSHSILRRLQATELNVSALCL